LTDRLIFWLTAYNRALWAPLDLLISTEASLDICKPFFVI
jgi:hypothetical protein